MTNHESPDVLEVDARTAAELFRVADERRRQHELWGLQRLPGHEWLGILAEEAGEVAKDVNALRWEKHLVTEKAQFRKLQELRKELIQTAAVAIAWAEHVSEELEYLEAITAGEAEDDEA